MDIVNKKPLVVFCISLVCGILISDIVNSFIFLTSLTILLSVIIFTFIGKLKIKLFICIGIVVFFSIGAFEFHFINHAISENFIKYDGITAKISGFVSSEPDIRASKITYLIDVIEVNSNGIGVKKGGKLLLSTANDGKSRIFKYGDKLEFKGKINLPSGIRNPGGFDYKKYLARKGASAVVFAQKYNITQLNGRRESFLIASGIKVRKSIAEIIEKSLPRQQAGLRVL